MVKNIIRCVAGKQNTYFTWNCERVLPKRIMIFTAEILQQNVYTRAGIVLHCVVNF